jgi:type II secretory pathway pseudopilin PulG
MFHCKQRCASSRRGVSLVEALMVVLILSVTATIAVVNVSSVTAIDPARQSALSFTEMLRSARELSITNQAPITLSLDRKAVPPSWRFVATGSAYGPSTSWDLPLPKDVVVDGTEVPIRFDAAGNASYVGNWKLSGMGRYQVMLEPIGARVTMKVIE